MRNPTSRPPYESGVIWCRPGTCPQGWVLAGMHHGRTTGLLHCYRRSAA